MTTTFETAKVGDKVWCMRTGWGEIRESGSSDRYPISVYFLNAEYKRYTVDGFYNEDDATRSLFWSEVVIEAPSKPLPALVVDSKVIVWVAPVQKFKRYFSHFDPSGRIACFADGATSWTSKHTVEWDNWELAE